MTDKTLAERLRYEADNLGGHAGERFRAAMREGAAELDAKDAEIGTLEAEMRYHEVQSHVWLEQVQRRDAEIARLTEALRLGPDMHDLAAEAVAAGRTRSSFAQEAEDAFDKAQDAANEDD